LSLWSVSRIVYTNTTACHETGLRLPREVGPIFSGIFLCFKKITIIKELLFSASIIKIPAAWKKSKVGYMIYQRFLLVFT
jgi:hypothetical protein